MSRSVTRLLKRARKLRDCLAKQPLSKGPRYTHLRDAPLVYIKEVLGINLTPDQVRVVEAAHGPPRRTLVASGHSVGKSNVAAALVNHFFDTRYPGIVLTTAPTERQVRDILWKEIRAQRERAGLPLCFAGPKSCRLETGPEHYAQGFTARDGTRFQGHHSPGGILVIFDEAEGVEPVFWEALKTMLDMNSIFLAIYNPTTPGSAAHLAEQKADEHGIYSRLTISCLDHPNIAAGLKGQPLPIPGAIDVEQLRGMLLEDSFVLGPHDEARVGDVELAGVRYRPGPVAEPRCLGRRPSEAITGLWSEALWARVLETRHSPLPHHPIAIGCDVGRYGDDQTVIIARKGLKLVHCETHVKQPTTFVAQRIKEVCYMLGDSHAPPRRIPVHIDEGGIGGGVIDQADGHLFLAVNASCTPRNPQRYVRVRDELWFMGRQAALEGLLDVSSLPHTHLLRLKAELMCAKYRVLPGSDKLQVSNKEDMKTLLKRSPDLADAFNLCMYPPPMIIS
jgi:hypothetical protein